jgi:hypothetical protein
MRDAAMHRVCLSMQGAQSMPLKVACYVVFLSVDILGFRTGDKCDVFVPAFLILQVLLSMHDNSGRDMTRIISEI